MFVELSSRAVELTPAPHHTLTSGAGTNTRCTSSYTTTSSSTASSPSF